MMVIVPIIDKIKREESRVGMTSRNRFGLLDPIIDIERKDVLSGLIGE